MPQPKDKDWLNGYKNKTPIYVVYKRPTSKRDTYRLKVNGWKKVFQANKDKKKAGVAILISDKTDFKTEGVKRDKEGHYIMVKGSIQEEDINNYKYICTQLGSTAICKTNANKYERGN